MSEYMKVSEVAKRWGLSSRRVRLMCSQDKIHGTIRKGNLYMIPINTPKPVDGRTLISMKDNKNPVYLSLNAKKAEIEKGYL